MPARNAQGVARVILNVMIRTVVALFALGQAAASSVDAVDGVYQLPDGKKIEVLGVCRIDAEGIACWDRSGASDATLTKRISDAYARPGSLDVLVRPGMKNRYVVFRRSSDLGLNVTDTDNLGRGTTADATGGEFLEWARFVMAPDATGLDAFVNVTNPTPLAPADLAFVRGTTLEYQGYRFELGEAKPSKEPPPAAYATTVSGKAWSVFWNQKAANTSEVEFSYEPLDKDGKPIRIVDKSGRPISQEKYLESIPANLNDFGRNGMLRNGFQRAVFQPQPQNALVPGVFPVWMNIDPKNISAVRISAMEKLRVRFPNLAVDPKP